MDDKIKYLDRKTYDNLCDQVRHVLTDAKAYEELTDKVKAVTFELAKSVGVKRKELISRIRRLEELVDKLLSCEVEDE